MKVMDGLQATATATASDIDRGRTAMSRTMLSKPLQQAFTDGLLDHGDIFDYGCGRGDDLKTLAAIGLVASGWDPAHRPDADRHSASVVNLGYVINVIEDPPERAAALREAWKLAKSALVVAARLTWDQDANAGRPFGDGYITSTGTFQKYYTHEELKAWIESVLGEPAITGAPGICYVFRDKGSAQQLLARNTRRSTRPRRGVAELLVEQHRHTLLPLEEFVSTHRRLPAPTEIATASHLVDTFGSIRGAFFVIRHATGANNWPDIDLGTKRRSNARFEEHLEDLQPLIDFVNERGRLPRSGELDNEGTLDELFGSPRAAFSLIRRVTGPAPWETVELAAAQNFLVYAALAAFGGRPKFSDLPEDLQYDAKDLFGSYTNACKSADRLLHSIADNTAINEACVSVPFGKLMPEALYIHVDYVSELPPLLRVYVGAALQITGNVDDATLLKINRVKPQVSFLVYPDFDCDPHPALHASIVAKLGEIRMKHRYFGGSANPPILHRKDSFLPETHPNWRKYNRLSRQEERAGLLDRPDIGTRDGWAQALAQAGYALHGHQLRELKGL
jgi:hypothetical protein